MDEDEGETSDCGEPIVELTLEWQSLIEKLWVLDERCIVNFLPEIVKKIKETKDPAIGETGLLTVLHSPKARDQVRNQPLELIVRDAARFVQLRLGLAEPVEGAAEAGKDEVNCLRNAKRSARTASAA